MRTGDDMKPVFAERKDSWPLEEVARAVDPELNQSIYRNVERKLEGHVMQIIDETRIKMFVLTKIKMLKVNK